MGTHWEKLSSFSFEKNPPRRKKNEYEEYFSLNDWKHVNTRGTLYPENNARTSKISPHVPFTKDTTTLCPAVLNVAVAWFFHHAAKIRLFESWLGPKNLPSRVEIHHTCSSEQQTYFRYSGHALHWFQSKNVFSIFRVTYTSVPYRVSQIPFTDK